MKRSLLALVVALVAGIAVFGAAATLGVTSKKVDSFASDQAATTSTTVGSAPILQTLQMFDNDTDGKVDRVVATFNEPLQASTDNTPWTVAGVPSNGTKGSLTVVGGSQVATLLINEGSGAADTAVGSFTVALAASASGIRDTAGNQASFLATAPADKASPLPTFVELLNKVGGTDGKPEQGDRAIVRFSEPLDRQTICGSAAADWATAGVGVLDDDSQVTVTLTEAATDTVTVTSTGCSSGLRFGTIALGDDGYISATRSFSGTAGNKSTLSWTPGSSEISVLFGARVGTDVTDEVNGNRTVTYTPHASLEDPSDNLVTGTKASANEKQF